MSDYHKRLQKETSAYRETPLQQCVPRLCHLEKPKFEPLAQKSFVLIQNQKQSDSDPESFDELEFEEKVSPPRIVYATK